MASPSSSRSPAVKRLMKEFAELQADPHPFYTAWPADDDSIFEWHFTVRGPEGTSFDSGIYHGRIILPPEYPFKPPSIIFLTPNGRFEVGKKICLSITGHHPEFWRPAWGIRTVLLAVISFMPTQGEGAIGALDYTDGERKILAGKSRDWCCQQCGQKNLDILPDTAKEEQKEGKRDETADELLSMMNLAYEGAKPATPAPEPAKAAEAAIVSAAEPAPAPALPVKTPEPGSTDENTSSSEPKADKGKGKESDSTVPSRQPTPTSNSSAPAPAPAPAPAAPSAARPPLGPSSGTGVAPIRIPATGVARPAGPQTPRPLTPRPHTPSMPTPPSRETPEEFQRRIRRERMYIDAAIAIVMGLLAWLVSRRMGGWMTHVSE